MKNLTLIVQYSNEVNLTYLDMKTISGKIQPKFMQHVSRLCDNKLEVTLENLMVCRPLISDICSGLSGDWTQNEETFARHYVATLSLTRLWNLIHLSLLGLSGIRISLVS